MALQSVFDASFAPYGAVLSHYDTGELLNVLKEKTERPTDSVIYVASEPELEKLSIYEQLQMRAYGGMPIQIGYCNGSNTQLNCIEYHRDSEIDIAVEDIILLVGLKSQIKNNQFDSSQIKAFLAPKGAVVQIYETTLHYAPCNGPDKEGFRVAIVLPLGTNLDKPRIDVYNEEDQLLWARNKWLLAHPDSSEAKSGAVAGITGNNCQSTSFLK